MELRSPDIPHAYLGENELVKEDVFFHIGQRYSRHNDQTADHQALAPCLEDQAISGGPTRVIRHGYLSLMTCLRCV